MLRPRDESHERAEVALGERLSSPCALGQEQDLFLDVRCQIQQVHNLRHPCSGDEAQAREIGAVDDTRITSFYSVGKIEIMVKHRPKPQPTWTSVKAKLAGFDRKGLLGLIQDLYAADKDNRTFLHARFGLGEDVLQPYKQTIDRWLWPDVLRKQGTSVAKAKQAIASYRKAVGEPAGLAELMVYYCEQAAGFCSDILLEDESYFAALVRMFDQALTVANTQSASSRDVLIARLDRVRGISHNIGYGVGDNMDCSFAKYVKLRG